MTTWRMTVRAVAALVLVAGVGAASRAQPGAVTPEWAFQQLPKQPGVNIHTPTPDQAARCKVEPIPNPKDPNKPMGYMVRDPDGKLVRMFVTYDGRNFNISSFFLDGVEAYREVYPPEPNAPYQFRWLGPNGTKWGLDRNRDGHIDEWYVISPEEVSQELLKAVATRDVKRLEALFATKEQLAGLGLPTAEVEKLKARAAHAAKRLAETADALKLSPNAKWIHAEFGIPQTRPADAFEGRDDFISYKNGTVLVEDGGKSLTFNTGELVLIGRSWKLLDGPSVGPAPTDGSTVAGTVVLPEIADLVAKLNDLDKNASAQQTVQALAKFYADRAALLEQITAKIPDSKFDVKETWFRMLIDSHATACEGGRPDSFNLRRLKDWHQAFINARLDGLAAYTAFRIITAENSIALANISKNEELGAVQEKWRSNLEAFVRTYPKAADAPEAVWRLAMAWELSGAKDAEAKAKEWYRVVLRDYPGHIHATKAAGAIKRLESEGQPLELVGPLLSNPAQPFNAAQKDKVVVVYYWASWSHSLADDAKKLEALAKTYGPKGLQIVTVGLDHDAKLAAETVARVGLPGTHLFAPGGLDASPLAAAYGILAPPHLLITDKTGKIVDNNAAVPMLEEQLKKLLDAE